MSDTPDTAAPDLQTMLVRALEAIETGDRKGGLAYLTRVATDHPAAFLGLLGKVLPLTLEGDAAAPLALAGDPLFSLDGVGLSEAAARELASVSRPAGKVAP